MPFANSTPENTTMVSVTSTTGRPKTICFQGASGVRSMGTTSASPSTALPESAVRTRL
jgi:hypothetical protein